MSKIIFMKYLSRVWPKLIGPKISAQNLYFSNNVDLLIYLRTKVFKKL